MATQLGTAIAPSLPQRLHRMRGPERWRGGDKRRTGRRRANASCFPIIGADPAAVEWCAVGLDRDWAYNPRCLAARPQLAGVARATMRLSSPSERTAVPRDNRGVKGRLWIGLPHCAYPPALASHEQTTDAVPARAAECHRADWFVIPGRSSHPRTEGGAREQHAQFLCRTGREAD
jgi:hypothetical protein